MYHLFAGPLEISFSLDVDDSLQSLILRIFESFNTFLNHDETDLSSSLDNGSALKSFNKPISAISSSVKEELLLSVVVADAEILELVSSINQKVNNIIIYITI